MLATYRTVASACTNEQQEPKFPPDKVSEFPARFLPYRARPVASCGGFSVSADDLQPHTLNPLKDEEYACYKYSNQIVALIDGTVNNKC